MTVYFYPSRGDKLIFTNSPDPKLKKKIDKLCQYNAWTTSEYQDTGTIQFCDFMHGYIDENGDCYDNGYYFYEQSIKTYEENKAKRKQELEQFKETLNRCIVALQQRDVRERHHRDAKNLIIKYQKLLERGYVSINENFNMSKRKRRKCKNSNLRYLTDVEIQDYKEKIKTETTKLKELESKIDTIGTIEKIFFEMKCTPEQMKREARKMNGRFNNYGDTVCLFTTLEEMIAKLDKDQYNECLENYEEVLRVDAEEKCRTRVVKNRTYTYIDKDGVERTLAKNIDQIICAVKSN